MSNDNKQKPNLAFGVKRVPGGWMLVEYQIKDGKIVKEIKSEPDLRSLTLEKLQNAMYRFWEAE